MRKFALCLLVALVACSLPATSTAGSIPAVCSACRAIGKELAAKLDKEVPKNHLDLRHRLDNEGKRYGKVINYKLSELRVIELLEGLCRTMNGYEFKEANATSGEPAAWNKKGELPKFFWRVGADEEHKLLENYCADVIERLEDDIAESLQQARVDSRGMSDFICFEKMKHCEERLPEEVEEAGEGEAKKEEL